MSPFLFLIKFGPRRPKSSPWTSLGHSRWFFAALLLRLGMLWWSWVLSSRFLLILGRLRGCPGDLYAAQTPIIMRFAEGHPFDVLELLRRLFRRLLVVFGLPWGALGELLAP